MNLTCRDPPGGARKPWAVPWNFLTGRSQTAGYAIASPANGPAEASDGLDFPHVGQEVPQQVLDAVLQRGGGGGATGAGALHGEVDHPVLEALEGDVAAIAGHGRA